MLFNGTTTSSGLITQSTQQTTCFPCRICHEIMFLLTCLDWSASAVLGYSWLCQHNLSINWVTHKPTFPTKITKDSPVNALCLMPHAHLMSWVHLHLTWTHLLTLCPCLNHLLTYVPQLLEYPYHLFTPPHLAFCLTYHFPILSPPYFLASSSHPPVLCALLCPSLTVRNVCRSEYNTCFGKLLFTCVPLSDPFNPKGSLILGGYLIPIPSGTLFSSWWTVTHVLDHIQPVGCFYSACM